MPVINEPRNNIAYQWDQGDSTYKLAMDANLRYLGLTSHLAALDILSTPPLSPLNGDTYIVGSSPTGVFGTHENDIAVHFLSATATWEFVTPIRGTQCYMLGGSQVGNILVFNTNWSALAAPSPLPIIEIPTISTTAVNLDARLIDSFRSANYLCNFASLTGALGFTCEISLAHNGTATTDATNIFHTISNIIQYGSTPINNFMIDSTLSGTSATQQALLSMTSPTTDLRGTIELRSIT